MNKGQLIDSVASDTKLKKTEISKVLDSILDSVKKSLKKGDDVSLVGFGTWKKKKRAARTGRNPQTGAAIKISAKNTVVFSSGKKLKDAVN
ncbi:MAG: DNA-binding protein HU [Candidatus Margulisbacteria bacterium GWF2_35_9]|nr:MAG: DNA-binding protein HU [Candidatus Margulisbacteria bacterium GWF2_35_9]